MRTPHADFLHHLDAESGINLKKLMRTCILATDMSQHIAMIKTLECKAQDGQLDFWEDGEDGKICLASVLLHAADLFNFSRPLPIAKMWAERIYEEFNAQAKKKGSLAFPVQDFMVTDSEQKLAGNEIYFSNTFVLPMWTILSLPGVFSEFSKYHETCAANIVLWESIKNKANGVSPNCVIIVPVESVAL
jgi:hypothetical protein